jgi:hypothetical protein
MPEEISFDEAVGHIERGLLRKLVADAEDEAVRELAGEILAGNISWSEAARSQAYGDVLAEMMAPLQTDPHLLSPQAIAGWDGDAHAFLTRLREDEGIVVVDLPDRVTRAPAG